MSAITSENGIETLKSRLHSTWTAGDYDLFSRYMENDARAFYERLDVPPGSPVVGRGLRIRTVVANRGARRGQCHRSRHCRKSH